MSILKKIVDAKRAETERARAAAPVAILERGKYFERETISLEGSLLDVGKHGIIAEFKRRSPSRGVINAGASSRDVCLRYLSSGASAVSVLTNGEFFGGSNDDLVRVREECDGPVLRKEFIIDEYQVLESKSIGADAILLIADILTGDEMSRFSALALSLKMEVLFEIHDESGIARLPSGARIIGVNSRNLGNFSIDMNLPGNIIKRLPQGVIRVAESGIHSPATLSELKTMGFGGFLIGELFMKEKDPGEACRKFINQVSHYKEAESKPVKRK